MTKTPWEKLTATEKLEVLRVDNERIFQVLNGLIADCGNNHRSINRTETKLNEVSKAVEALERRLPVKAL